MALGDPYVSLDEIKGYLDLDVSVTSRDTRLTDAINSASREIELFCNRQFNKQVTATARVFGASSCHRAVVDDFHTTTGLIVKLDTGDSGTFDTTLAATDYELGPLNGVVDGQSGWPYWQINATGSYSFPVGAWRRRSGVLEVTAQWGWDEVPAPVKQACFILAANTYKLADAPNGIAGLGEFGVARVHDMPQVQAKLARYVRTKVFVG